MEYYESKYTGAEVDALLDKVNDVGVADWNAQKSEAGYIENKPFGIIKSNNSQITNINSYFIITEDAYYPTTDLFIKYNNKTVLLAKEKQELYWGDGATVDIGDNIYFLGDDGDSNIVVTTDNEINFELIIGLSSEFISNTVLKTTPQTLSDDAKNQALANLGIPRVLNINIYGIEDNLTIDELSEILGDCVTNEILILGLCYRSKYSTVYLPTLHQSYTDLDGRKILNKLVCGQYRVDEDSYDFHLVVCPSVYLYYDEDTQNYRYFLEEY